MCRRGLVAKGEESTEMGGYFICNGIERIIRMIVLQRRHYIMALRRGAYRKRGSNYTENATVLRWVFGRGCQLSGARPWPAADPCRKCTPALRLDGHSLLVVTAARGPCQAES